MIGGNEVFDFGIKVVHIFGLCIEDDMFMCNIASHLLNSPRGMTKLILGNDSRKKAMVCSQQCLLIMLGELNFKL